MVRILSVVGQKPYSERGHAGLPISDRQRICRKPVGESILKARAVAHDLGQRESQNHTQRAEAVL